MKAYKRSNEPVFWGLFGAGGMWGAWFAPAAILALLLFPAFGLDAGRGAWEFVTGTVLGKLFMLGMIILPLWCGLHRIHHCLHDLKIHSPVVKMLCYGLALVFSLVALVLVIAR